MSKLIKFYVSDEKHAVLLALVEKLRLRGVSSLARVVTELCASGEVRLDMELRLVAPASGGEPHPRPAPEPHPRPQPVPVEKPLEPKLSAYEEFIKHDWRQAQHAPAKVALRRIELGRALVMEDGPQTMLDERGEWYSVDVVAWNILTTSKKAELARRLPPEWMRVYHTEETRVVVLTRQVADVALEHLGGLRAALEDVDQIPLNDAMRLEELLRFKRARVVGKQDWVEGDVPWQTLK